MSLFTARITTPIYQDGAGGFVAATVIATLTQITEAKVKIPKKGAREAEFTANLQSVELNPLYAGAATFETYASFLHVKWRGFNVFWGPIIAKDVDFDGSTISVRARDHHARLEHHYYRVGDDAMNHPTDETKGFITVDTEGLRLSRNAGNVPAASDYIPLGIRMGTDDFGVNPADILIERGQEINRTMEELGDRTDGPLFELEPLDETDGEAFYELNSFGQIRDDVSDVVKFHYNTGLKNLRNVRLSEGGLVLSHAHVLSQDNDWRVTTASAAAGHAYGMWVQWENVDFNVRDEAEAELALGAVGDAFLDAYGRPQKNVELELRRDDEIGATDQFYYLTDFKVAVLVEVQAVRANEEINGVFQVDEVRLEQEPDGTGQVRQFVDVIPFVSLGGTYVHNTDQITDD